MKKDALSPERYTPNPQYSACPTALPLLNRESLVFLQEIGEGCFGKVFKGNLFKFLYIYAPILLCNISKFWVALIVRIFEWNTDPLFEGPSM